MLAGIACLSIALTPLPVRAGPPLRVKDRLVADLGDKEKDKDTDKAKDKDEAPKDPISKSLMFLDKFGNPQGGDLGLSKDGEFKGKKLLVWGHLKGEHQYVFREANPMWVALRKRGFEVQLADKEFPADILLKFDQFWLISYDQDNLKDADIAVLEKFVAAGKGVYLLADNEPYLAQTNVLARRWFDTDLKGSYHGTQIGFVKTRKLKEEVIKKFNGQYAIDDHALLTGVNFVYEGITISHFAETKKLQVIMRGSDGKPLVGVSTVPGKRVIVDCGFTRYFFDERDPEGSMSFINRTAGTLRYGENVAAFLQGKEKRF